MSHAYEHALSSVKIHGGCPEDYLDIHCWFDEFKSAHADFRARILRHHSEGIRECVKHFGVTIINSDGNVVPVSVIGEQHVMEDCGWIPSFTHWAQHLSKEPWMNSPTVKSLHRYKIPAEDASNEQV